MSVTRFVGFKRSSALDSAPVIRVLCLKVSERHVDLFVRHLVTLRIGAFSQTWRRELMKALVHPIFDELMYRAINFP
jgi:hypothetical protein